MRCLLFQQVQLASDDTKWVLPHNPLYVDDPLLNTRREPAERGPPVFDYQVRERVGSNSQSRRSEQSVYIAADGTAQHAFRLSFEDDMEALSVSCEGSAVAMQYA
jgi:hypothetical protein